MLCDWKMSLRPNEEVTFSFRVGRKRASQQRDGADKPGEFVNELRFGSDSGEFTVIGRFDPVTGLYGTFPKDLVDDLFQRYYGVTDNKPA